MINDNREGKITVVNPPNELTGCGVLLIGLGICISTVIWAISGFPAFWR